MPQHNDLSFCRLCWDAKTTASSYAHIRDTLHVWCAEHRVVLVGGYHSLAHMKKDGRCAKGAKCMRCGEGWNGVKRQIEAKAKEKKAKGKGNKEPEHSCDKTMQGWGEKRVCPGEGCERWLVSEEHALRHLATCARESKVQDWGEKIGKLVERELERLKKEGKETRLQETRDQIFAKLREKGKSDDSNKRVRKATEDELKTGHPMEMPGGVMKTVIHRCRTAIRLGREAMATREMKRDYQKGSQMEADIHRFVAILTSAQVGNPLTAIEYLERVESDAFDEADWVVCTHRQANILMLYCPPKRPILILNSPGSPVTLTQAEVMRQLRDQNRKFEIHDLTRANKSEFWNPVTMPIEDFERVSLDPQGRPLNILSLSPFRNNAVPECLELDDYQVVRTVIASDEKSKSRTDGVKDCSAFGLFALMGAMSNWHIDMNLFDTAAGVEGLGRKLWILCPGIPMEKCVEYITAFHANTHYVAPDWPAVGVAMEEGDVLLQPHGTLHAPYSPNAVAMSGTMHWSKRTMGEVVGLLRVLLRHTDLSNELPAPGLLEKLDAVGRTWKAQLDKGSPNGWPERGLLNKYLDDLEVRYLCPFPLGRCEDATKTRE